MASKLDEDLEALKAERTSRIPVGRIGNPEEIGAFITFLSGQYGGYINGDTIRMDGGMVQSLL